MTTTLAMLLGVFLTDRAAGLLRPPAAATKANIPRRSFAKLINVDQNQNPNRSNGMEQVESRMRQAVAILRITLGVILLVTWYKNLQDGIYTADGIVGLFNYLFNDNGGGPAFYRALINGTILQVPGLFAVFQLVGELLLGLGLLVGILTPSGCRRRRPILLQSVSGLPRRPGVDLDLRAAHSLRPGNGPDPVRPRLGIG